MPQQKESTNSRGHRLIRLPVVKDRTGSCKSTIYELVRAGEFPRPVALGPKSVAWIEAEVDEWIARKINASRKVQP